MTHLPLHRAFALAPFLLTAIGGAAANAADMSAEVSLDPGARFADCADCPEMVVIPPGEFTMGRDGGESEERYEGPPHPVSIGYSFAVGRTEVTVGQFAEFVRETGHETIDACINWTPVSTVAQAVPIKGSTWQTPGYGRPAGLDEPVACVTWRDAAAYAEWLAEKTGQPYRLLSEAEWEYVAKAGAETPYPWGEDASQACRYGNVFDATAQTGDKSWEGVSCSDGYPQVSPVGQFEANAFGLHDITGNVWEWVQDCYRMPYPDDVPTDGSAYEVEGECDRRSVRGGSWITWPDRQRPSWRGRDPETLATWIFGFRIARDLP